MNKKYIITSGCSFTAHNGTARNNGNLSWAYCLSDILGNSYQVDNVAISGQGNYTISLNAINQVDTLLNKGVDAKDIIVLTQWSGLFRPTLYSELFDEKKVPFDEIAADNNLKELQKAIPHNFINTAARRDTEFWAGYYEYYYTTPQAFIDNLDIILKTQWYLESKNIKFKMFTGWDIFTTVDGSNGNFGKDKILRPNQFSKGEYSNISNNLLTELYPWSRIFWDKIDWNNFWVFSNDKIKYGGMTQWVQNNLPIDDWYCQFPSDVHPSNKAHKKFANDVVKTWIS